VHAIGTNHFHMLANVLEAAHRLVSFLGPSLKRSAADWDARCSPRLRLFPAQVIGLPGLSD
jgi:hypothetical protein